MKKIIFIILSLIFVIAISCSKDDVKTDIKNTSDLHKYKTSIMPPIREFECGEQTVPASPYPCPNASCPYIGWDCAVDVLIIGIPNLQAYNDASSLLDTYISSENTSEFFNDYTDQAVILMPELANTERYDMLNDLKEGITSVRKHPVFSEEYEQYINIYQIYVVENGESPNYGELD